MNMAVTKNDLGSVVMRDPIFKDEPLTFSSAGTVLGGTILARDSSTGKMIPYVKGGSTNDNGVPKAVLTYEVTATSAGDVHTRVAIGGVFNKSRIVINADGDNSNVDNTVLDAMRLYGLYAETVQDISVLDNQ
jgi:hypothetical protein